MTDLPDPPFSAKEWQDRAWLTRFVDYLQRYLDVELQPWQERIVKRAYARG